MGILLSQPILNTIELDFMSRPETIYYHHYQKNLNYHGISDMLVVL